jgi:hypothetical protein
MAAVALFSAGAHAEHEKEKAAVEASKVWLALIDGSKYSESWTESASAIKASIKKEEWSQLVDSVRKPLGAKTSRVLRDAAYATSLPKAPPGEYVMITYDTKFANKPPATETVAMMLDNGKWRAAGYFIK